MTITVTERGPGKYVYTTDEDVWTDSFHDKEGGYITLAPGWAPTRDMRLIARAGGSISGRDAARLGLLDPEHAALYEYSSSVTGRTLEPAEIVERHFARVAVMDADDDAKARARVAGAAHVVPSELSAEQRKQLAEDLDLVISEQTDAVEAGRLQGVQRALREEGK